MTAPTATKERCSRVLNRVRLAAGGVVPYADLREWVWPEQDWPRSWKSQLATFAFMLRDLGYPVVTEFGRGLRFEPRPHVEKPKQHRPNREANP